VTRIAGGLRSFALFWWDFIVGDDWRIAAGVILALAGTAAIATTSAPAWWLVPIAVAALLAGSLRRAVRTRR
jgi:hypothetical protein